MNSGPLPLSYEILWFSIGALFMKFSTELAVAFVALLLIGGFAGSIGYHAQKGEDND